jgi:uncharacterized phage protein gp47/JayE
LVRDQIRAHLPGADSLIPNSVLRVMSDVQGALCHLVLQFIDWLALQLLPDTAEHEWLERHGHIWLTNADGTTGRKHATLAAGTVTVTSQIPWTRVPQATQMIHNNIGYETLEEVFTPIAGNPVPVRVRALDPGAAGNVNIGTNISVISDVPGLDNSANVLSMYGGTDSETDDQLRYRVLLRIREPPMGGSKTDYEAWALAVPGCTRAWTNPLEMGMGTVTVRVMFDDLRRDQTQGFPIEEDILAVRDYIDQVRPVAVKDVFVVPPIPQRINIIVWRLVPDTPAIRAGIETSWRDMVFEKAIPGQPMYAVWKTCAVQNAPGVISFTTDNVDEFMLSPGHLAVPGDVIYG